MKTLRNRNLICAAFLCAVLSTLVTGVSWAQVSATQPITLTATKAESIAVTVTAGSTVTFALNGGTTAGNVNPAWTTTWNLKATSTPLVTCVYLPSALTGTGGNLDTIPAANLYGQPEGVGGFSALTGTACGQTGDALQIHSTVISGANHKNGSENDSVGLEINETSPPITLSVDTYSGTMFIIASAP